MDVRQQYEQFLKKWKEISLLRHTTDLLDWDQATVMPKGEGGTRAEQMALFAGMINDKLSDNELYDLVSTLLEQLEDLDNFMKANLREALKEIGRNRAVPTDLIAAIAKETSLAMSVWEKAREENSWESFSPSLENILKLVREKAMALMSAGFGLTPYGALFSDFEPGISIAEVDVIFDELRKELPPLVQKVMATPAPDDSFMFFHYPNDLQEKVSREIITKMGLDWDRCRLDVSTHPFTCSPAHASPRITSRYDGNNLLDSIFSATHEAGHALYEQGLPPDLAYQPIGNAAGLSVHESQSRFWDAWVGRSYIFWMINFDKMRQIFPDQLEHVNHWDFYRAVNKAKLGFIRTDADPLTYNLHILLRYDIEKMMIDGNLPVKDIPTVWNEKFKEYFGIEVPDDRQGALQDVHWSCSLIGYFPTYTLGNIISSQLYEEMEKDIGIYVLSANNGHFGAIREWLREKIHKHGSFYGTQELIERVTGRPISVDVFLKQLKKRYSNVYGINLS